VGRREKLYQRSWKKILIRQLPFCYCYPQLKRATAAFLPSPNFEQIRQVPSRAHLRPPLFTSKRPGACCQAWEWRSRVHRNCHTTHDKNGPGPTLRARAAPQGTWACCFDLNPFIACVAICNNERAFCEARRLELRLPALGRRGYIYLLCGDVYVASEYFTPEPYARQQQSISNLMLAQAEHWAQGAGSSNCPKRKSWRWRGGVSFALPRELELTGRGSAPSLEGQGQI